jgi:hypothetical protein
MPGRRRIEVSPDGIRRGAELLSADKLKQVESGEHVSRRDRLSVV